MLTPIFILLFIISLSTPSSAVVVFPVANESVIWSLQAISPILKINGYSTADNTKFKRDRIFSQRYDFITLADLYNLTVNTVTPITLAHCIRTIAVGLHFDLTEVVLANSGSGTSASKSATEQKMVENEDGCKWHIYYVTRDTRVEQIAVVNEMQLEKFTLPVYTGNGSDEEVRRECKELNDESVKVQVRELKDTNSKVLCYLMMVIEMINARECSELSPAITRESKNTESGSCKGTGENVTKSDKSESDIEIDKNEQSEKNTKFNQQQDSPSKLKIKDISQASSSFRRTTDIPQLSPKSITPVSFYRGMIGFLILLIDPVQASNFYHSLSIPGMQIREEIEKIILFLSEYYYMSSTDDASWFQHENLQIIQSAKYITNQLVRKELCGIFGSYFSSLSQTNPSDQERFSAVMQAIIRLPPVIHLTLAQPHYHQMSSTSVMDEQLRLFIKYYLQVPENTLQSIDLLPAYEQIHQQQNSVDYFVSAMLKLSTKYSELFAFKCKTYNFCDACKHVTYVAKETLMFLQLPTCTSQLPQQSRTDKRSNSRDNPVPFSVLLQHLFNPGPSTCTTQSERTRPTCSKCSTFISNTVISMANSPHVLLLVFADSGTNSHDNEMRERWVSFDSEIQIGSNKWRYTVGSVIWNGGRTVSFRHSDKVFNITGDTIEQQSEMAFSNPVMVFYNLNE